eukprot:6751847-Prymnesium_polylepis.1
MAGEALGEWTRLRCGRTPSRGASRTGMVMCMSHVHRELVEPALLLRLRLEPDEHPLVGAGRARKEATRRVERRKEGRRPLRRLVCGGGGIRVAHAAAAAPASPVQNPNGVEAPMRVIITRQR